MNRSFKKMMNILENSVHQSENLTTTLFLGDLSITSNEGNLYELFSRFGSIESVQLKKSERDPQRAHLGFGFIKFRNHDSAERALQEMNGYFFLGRAMRVGWALSNEERQSQLKNKKSSHPQKNQTAQIHVMFVTKELNRRVSELDLGGVFRRYGNLVDIAIKKNVTNNEYGIQSGYAFLHFALTSEGLTSALTAVEEVNNLVVDNIAFQCKLTHNLQTHLLSMKHSHKPHILPTSLIDPTLKTYGSHLELPHSVDSPFHSYAMSPTKSNGSTDRSYESFVSPSRQVLYHVNPFNKEGRELSRTHQTTISDLSQSSTTNNNADIYQHYPDHYYEQPKKPLSSSSISSSFVNHIYEKEMMNTYEEYNNYEEYNHHNNP